MADDFSSTTTPLVAPGSFSVVGGKAPLALSPGDVSLMYLLSYFSTVANANAAQAWNAAGVAPNVPVVRRIFPDDPDEIGMSEAYLPAMFLWCTSVGEAYRKAEDYLVRDCKLRLLWIPHMPPGQDKQKTRGPFGKGLHAVLVQAIDQLRDPSWTVVGDTDPLAIGGPNPVGTQFSAKPGGSLISNFVKFYHLFMTSWKPVKWVEKGMGPGVNPLVFDAFEGELEMLELWNVDLGRFDLLSGGLVETLVSADVPPRIIGVGSNT